jgi:hypothetical protein
VSPDGILGSDVAGPVRDASRIAEAKTGIGVAAAHFALANVI